jgi:chemotaxis-related protein WspB
MLALTFQSGSDRLALDIRRVREVVPHVRLQPVAGSPEWLAGVFVYRGQVVPVFDLQRLVGAGEHPVHLSTRIILLAHSTGTEERLVGLLAAQVADIRELELENQPQTHFAAPGRTNLGPVLVDGTDIVHLVEPDRLLPELYDQRLLMQVGGATT